MRDRRLADPDQRGDVADAELAAAQRVEDADPRGIAEDAEGVCDVADGVAAHQRALGGPRFRAGRGAGASHGSVEPAWDGRGGVVLVNI